MTLDRENPKTEHEKKLHQNTTNEKGPIKEEHYNQYGKKDDEHKKRGARKKD
jgi:hypothetical protein